MSTTDIRGAPPTALGDSEVMDDGRSRADLDRFLRVRTRLFAVAYRIVGNAHDAEDVLQDVWLRWHRTDRAAVVNAEAFLVTATTRLAINLVQSARRRREIYGATWPDEPVVDGDADPSARTERAETIALAVQVLVARLPPAERAAFVLREGFEYPYQQVARALRIGTANARQLVTRARTRIAAGGGRWPGSPADGRLARAFAASACGDDLAGLEALLAAALVPTR